MGRVGKSGAGPHGRREIRAARYRGRLRRGRLGERATQPGKNLGAIAGKPALQNNFHALGGGADARIIVAGFAHDFVQADVIVIGVVMIED